MGLKRSKSQISFVFPTFNEEEVIDSFFSAISSLVNESLKNYQVELIFVNDGSTDNTADKLNEIVNTSNLNITVLEFSRNFGHQAAITAGMDYASGDCAIVMDTDLQDPPEVVVEMLAKWEQGYDVVYGRRKSRQDSRFKRATAFVFYRLLNKLSAVKIPEDSGDFRLVDRKVLEALKHFTESQRYIRGLFAYAGFKQTAVEFERHVRKAGETKYSLSKMAGLALNGITGFSVLPLNVIWQIGFFLILLPVLTSTVVFLAEIDIEVNLLIVVSSVSIFTGVQMICLGIVAIYLGRIFLEVKNRPLYFVKSIIHREN